MDCVAEALREGILGRGWHPATWTSGSTVRLSQQFRRWFAASEGMRGRIVHAAKTLLTETPFRTLVWYPSTQVPYLASAGVNALSLLCGVDLACLQRQSTVFWAAWLSEA